MTEIERLADTVAVLAEKVSSLAAVVLAQNERWEEQGRVNQVVLEHGRALYGSNGNEGVVGSLQTHRRDNVGSFEIHSQRIKALEAAEAASADRRKFARRLVIAQAALLIGGLILAGVLFYLGW